MTAEIAIHIRADANDATQQLVAFGRSLDDAQSSAQGLASEMVGQLIPSWTNAGAALLDIAGRLRDVAEDYDRLSDIQEALGTASQDLASEMTQGLIPALELAQARGTALAAGLELTDQQFAAVAVAAQLYAQRTGIDGAQAVDRLSSAIVSGNQRALRPFGIHLQEGSTRAEGAAEALRQLSAAADQNAAAVERSTGGLDHLSAAYTKVKEAAVTFYGGIMNFALDGLHQFGVSVGTLAAALASGDSGSLSSAFFSTTDAAHTFAERIPLVGAAVAAQARAVRDFAASLFGLRRELAPASGSTGSFDLADDEVAQGIGDAYATLAPLGGPQTPTPARRGGGGGGGGGDRAGARGAIDQAISDAEVARLRGNRPDGRGGPESGITRNRAGGNAQGGAGNAGVAIQNTGLSRTANLVKNLGDAYEQLGATATTVLSGLGSAVSEHFEAWAMGRETMGEALAGMTADLFKWMGQQALKKAGMEAVEAIAAAARYDFGAAALHAAAAVGFGALAGGSFYVAGQVAPGKSTHGRDDAGTGRSSTRDLGGRGGESGGQPLVINNYYAPGANIGQGGFQQLARTMVENINQGIRTRQPGFRIEGVR